MKSEAKWDLVESRIFDFEESWQRGETPVLSDFLPEGCDSSTHRELLQELICIDLEYRWRFARQRKAGIVTKSLGDYAELHPELGPPGNWPLELIGEEYRVRQIWGDHPTHADILARFSDREAEIRPLLGQIDDERLAETRDGTPITPDTVPRMDDGRPDPQAPLAYSDYKLEKLIGAGLMGRVYRAWQQSLDRPVAVKYLRKSFHHDREAVARFLAEARTVAKLRHPRIVGIHGLGRTPQGGYFIVMDWIDGPNLAEVLKSHGPVDADTAVRWMREACEGLEQAHAQGIIHCDLKPGNLLLDGRGHVHITDFGLSRSLSDESRIGDRIEGTAPFMAPEQIAGHWGAIDVRTDVYGLGAVLYTLLTGRPPCEGRTPADVLANVVSGSPITAPAVLRPTLPPALNDLCLRCLAKSPADRFSNLAELAASLGRVQREMESST